MSVKAAAESIASVPTRFFSKYGVASRPCMDNKHLLLQIGVMAEEKVYEFLEKHNRPFSAGDIHKNLGDVSRGDVQKALSELVDDDRVLEKIYGKQKVYCVVQGDENAGVNMEDELKEMDRQINTLTSNLEEINKKLQTKTSKLQEDKGKMSVDEAIAEKNRLEAEILALKNELKSFEECTKPFPEEERVKICEDYRKYEKEYKSRKKMCREVINGIMENYPKSEKVLLGEIGIETDEDVGFVYEQILN